MATDKSVVPATRTKKPVTQQGISNSAKAATNFPSVALPSQQGNCEKCGKPKFGPTSTIASGSAHLTQSFYCGCMQVFNGVALPSSPAPTCPECGSQTKQEPYFVKDDPADTSQIYTPENSHTCTNGWHGEKSGGESVPSTPSPTTTTLNLNDVVFVRLTLQGEEVEREWYSQLKLDPGKHIRPAENGWRRFQLYELMNFFGHEMYSGNTRQMFRENEIRLGMPSTPVETSASKGEETPPDDSEVKAYLCAEHGRVDCLQCRQSTETTVQAATPVETASPDNRSKEERALYSRIALKIGEARGILLSREELRIVYGWESQLTQVREELAQMKGNSQ